VFVDTNILIFSTVRIPPRHLLASEKRYALYGRDEPLWISRQVLREYLATATRLQSRALPEAVADVRRFESVFRVAENGPTVTTQLPKIPEDIPAGGRQIHDANIVATMLTYGIRELLTDNVADFVRYSSLVEIIPLDA
jgi:predicted nucleic acid-binding protein